MAKPGKKKGEPLSIDEAGKEELKQEGLVYYPDTRKGYSRRRRGKGFSYYDTSGNLITDEKLREKLNKLAIPPAWKGVWISPRRTGHLQATGRDAKGRKQYIYHEKWTELRNRKKFDRMIDFAHALTKIRDANEKHLHQEELTREKVLAAIVELMDETNMRIGNRVYARQNESYGISTLRKKHFRPNGNTVSFEFCGKSGVYREVTIDDQELVEVIHECAEIPGYEIFKYFDEEGRKHYVESDDVNLYLHEISGSDFTSKDFRTWSGTVAAFKFFSEEPVEEDKERQKMVPGIVKRVAEHLANTPAICRSHYIHPAVIRFYEEGRLTNVKTTGGNKQLNRLDEYEMAVVKLLQTARKNNC